MINIMLDERDFNLIRQALRSEEERHKKAGFNALAEQAQELRSRLADVAIDTARELTLR
jgi:hypothetical protein